MSFKIIKSGICDTFQDEGRSGFQHLGINPGGVMDKFAMNLVNAVVGNESNVAVLEMHFPAATILVEDNCLIAIAGADFAPEINGITIPLNQPVWISAGSTVKFARKINGSCCYLAVHGGFVLQPWLNSNSTHIKLGAGGWRGRVLRKEDEIHLKKSVTTPLQIADAAIRILPWGATCWKDPAPDNEVCITAGPEFEMLNEQSRSAFEQGLFTILPASDRMAYSLKGPELITFSKAQLVSSAVAFGTLQLLPDGQLMVLMADHQTTGGYPRIGQVIHAHLSRLAQRRPGDEVRFRQVSLEQAQQLWLQQYKHLTLLKYAAGFKMESLKLQS